MEGRNSAREGTDRTPLRKLQLQPTTRAITVATHTHMVFCFIGYTSPNKQVTTVVSKRRQQVLLWLLRLVGH